VAASAPARFACSDSLQRADGAQRAGTHCNIEREYCYEASGGAALSHGAHCRALPKPGATCSDLVAIAGAGSSCTGAPSSGLRLQFAYPFNEWSGAPARVDSEEPCAPLRSGAMGLRPQAFAKWRATRVPCHRPRISLRPGILGGSCC
jgi:hypothetical protein